MPAHLEDVGGEDDIAQAAPAAAKTPFCKATTWTCAICQKCLHGSHMYQLRHAHINAWHPSAEDKAQLRFRKPMAHMVVQIPEGATPTWKCKHCNKGLLTGDPCSAKAGYARRSHHRLAHPE